VTRSSERAHLTILGLGAGAAWGVIAWLLGGSAFGPAIWPSVLGSPLIGALVARLIHPRFAQSGGLGRALWSLSSLYGGALLFSLPLAVGQPGGRPAAEVAVESLVAVLWGVTMTGFVLVLWPMAYLTHRLIEWRLD
jgi:hypothetical protein